MPNRVSPRTGLPHAVSEAARTAARHAADADDRRGLAPEVVDAILDAGVARHFVPTRWGGDAGSCTDLLHSVATLGEGCTSAAWYASVLAGAARMGSYLPDAGQQELWAKGADARVIGALMPRGEAVPVPGGWRVAGEWDFTSGAGYADWALACALVPSDEGQEPWFLAVPRQEYQVRDTWFNVGMRGTASNTLVLDDTFVPRHRGFPRADMLAGRSIGSSARCHTAPLRLLSGLLFAAPALGAARGALADWTTWAAAGAGTGGTAPPQALTAARAAGEIDAAGLLLERAARVADQPAATAEEAVRNPADCALAVDRLVSVVERLFRTVGSRGQAQSERLQRAWRDVHCLASHVALRFDTAAGAYGSHLLGAAG